MPIGDKKHLTLKPIRDFLQHVVIKLENNSRTGDAETKESIEVRDAVTENPDPWYVQIFSEMQNQQLDRSFGGESFREEILCL